MEASKARPVQAKDTVMKKVEHTCTYSEFGHLGEEHCPACQCKAQAEISFKAGQDQQFASLLVYAQSGELDKGVQEIKQAGMVEVVEWMREHGYSVVNGEIEERTNNNPETFVVDNEELEAKLKEWGIDEAGKQEEA